VITTNVPPTGKCHCKSKNQEKAATTIKPQQQVDEFIDKHLVGNSSAASAKWR